MQRWRGPHDVFSLLRVGVVVPAQVNGLALRGCEFCKDHLFVLLQLLGDGSEVGKQFRILILACQRLGPVKGEVVVAAAIVGLSDLCLR